MRKKKTRKEKSQEIRRRYDAIKNLMSTFAMSTVAVVAVVTLIPASPKAEIIKTVALSEEVTYQVKITDEENALDTSTLSVVLENQLEYYEQPLDLGENSGYFENLKTNTEYRLSVYGSKGFGKERLDTTMITTREKVGATILQVTKVTEDIVADYIADISVYDPDLKYTSITLYYGQAWELDQEITYNSIPITQNRMEIELFDIFGSEPFHVYIEGITLEGSEILDEMWVTPPFELNAYAYLEGITKNEVAFYFYGDSYVGVIDFKVNVYLNDLLVTSKTFSSDPNDYEHSRNVVDGLSKNTSYIIECIAIYTNPQTLREEQKLVNSFEISTLGDYSYNYNIVEYDTYYEIQLDVTDPNDYFQNVSYEIYETSEMHEMYLEGNSYLLETIDDIKTYTFTIDKPDVSSYKIYIRMNNQTEFNIFEIIDILEIN